MRSAALMLTLSALFTGPAQAQTGGFLVSGAWLDENLYRSDLVILHVGNDRAGYEAEHIPGARFFSYETFVWDGESGVGAEIRSPTEIDLALEGLGVSDQSQVVLYGPNPLQVARAWMTLDVMGATGGPPLYLDGGLQLWKEEGRPLTAELPRYSSARLTLRPDTSRIVDADWILARLGHDYLSLVDGRSDDEFSGADGGGGGSLNPGHIPGAKQVFWEDLIVSRERPLLRPRAELEALFSDAVDDPNDTVVTYCTVGMRASMAYMVARLLGYEARIYDGSWRDWGSRSFPFIARGGGLPHP